MAFDKPYLADIEIPPYVYSCYFHHLGVQTFGLYSYYHHLFRQHGNICMPMAEIAVVAHVGRSSITKMNRILKALGMIDVIKPNGNGILNHESSVIVVYIPPQRSQWEIVHLIGEVE